MRFNSFLALPWLVLALIAALSLDAELSAQKQDAPVFKNPEEAWQSFLDALASGDKRVVQRLIGGEAYSAIAVRHQLLGADGLKMATANLKKVPFKIQPLGTTPDKAFLCLQKFGEKTVFVDTFTEMAITLKKHGRHATVPEHIPDQGKCWTLNEDTSHGKCPLFDVHTGAHKVTPNTVKLANIRTPLPGGALWQPADGVRVSYFATPEPALSSADYYIQFLLREEARGSGSQQNFTWAMLRRTAADTYYGAGWYPNLVANNIYIFKVVGGRYTELAKGQENFTEGSVIRFEVVGDVLTLYKDGVKVLSATGGQAITAIGSAGFGAGNIRQATDRYRSDTLSLDDLSIVERVPVTTAGTWENASPLTFVKVGDNWKIEARPQGLASFLVSGVPGFKPGHHGPG